MSEIEETKITVMEDWTGSRLDRFVRAVRPALSFPVIQTLIRKGKIRLNGEKVPGKARLKDGDVVEIRLRKDRPAEVLPEVPAGDEKPAMRFGDIGMGIAVLHRGQGHTRDRQTGRASRAAREPQRARIAPRSAVQVPASRGAGPGRTAALRRITRSQAGHRDIGSAGHRQDPTRRSRDVAGVCRGRAGKDIPRRRRRRTRGTKRNDRHASFDRKGRVVEGGRPTVPARAP